MINSSSEHGFAPSDATLAAAELRVGPLSMRFSEPAVERDFLRYRITGRVAIVIAFFAAYAIAFAAFVAETPNVPYMVVIAVNVFVLLAEIITVACSRPASLESQAARAARHERITAVGNFVSTLIQTATAAATFQQRCGASPTRAAYRDCMTQFDFSITLALTTVMVAPRMTYIVPLTIVPTIVYVLNVNLSHAFLDPVDYVSDAVVLSGYLVALNVAAWAKECRERTVFVTVVKLWRANAAIDEQRDAMRVALAAVLPASLLHDGALSEGDVSHHSMHATVAVVDIFRFSLWTTWHLEVDVLYIVNAVLSAYDAVVKRHDGVDRAMTCGDTYTVCSGLLEARRDHADAIMTCAVDMRVAARRLSDALEHSKFNTRTCIVSGELRGRIVGTTSRRYAVTGPAFDQASDMIGQCERDGVVAVIAAAPDVGHGGVGNASPQSSAVPVASDGKPNGTGIGTETEVELFSPLWLTFDNTVVGSPVDSPLLMVAEGVVPAIVITALLVAVVAEHASTDPRRHHSAQPAGLALLCAGFLTAWVNVAALVAAKAKLPVAAATALKVAPVALTGYGLVLLLCYYAQARVPFVVTLGMLCRFDLAVPWLLQLLCVCVAAVVPSLAYSLRRTDAPVNLAIAFVGVPAMCVLHRYFTVRADCEHAVAAVAAARSGVRAGELSRALDTMLGGLVPPHAMGGVALAPGGHRANEPANIEACRALTVVQVKLHCSGPELPHVWDCVGAALNSAGGAGGLLELAQAGGDTLLVAGPFAADADDAAEVAAARQALAFVRDLAARLRATTSTFTAVATTGSAYGALFGAAKLTFGVFGAAVRENVAIMTAAPRPIGEPRNMAFASDSFRRQERNFAPRRPADVRDAAMSAALAVSDAEKQSDADKIHTNLGGRADAFGAEMMWRAAGLGIAPVSIVTL
jgi:hypothetical protein